MDRISEIFSRRRAEHRAALIIFISAGYPTMDDCEKAVERAIAGGADIIELGVPFSDPMADGPVICNASRIALEQGTTLESVLQLAGRIRRKHPKTGLILFSYMNPIFHYGLERLGQELQDLGVDGLLAVDLPLEERGELDGICRSHGLHLIPLVSPVTPEARIRQIVSNASGFVYCISVRGITGARKNMPADLAERLELVRRLSPIPVAAGFGIADSAAAEAVAKHADGVIVGSAFVQTLPDLMKAECLVQNISKSIHH